MLEMELNPNNLQLLFFLSIFGFYLFSELGKKWVFTVGQSTHIGDTSIYVQRVHTMISGNAS